MSDFKTPHTFSRYEDVKQTPYGEVKVKVSTGYGVKREKPEHDDLEILARANGFP